MSKKVKGIAASGASVLVLLIGAIFGINLSSDKNDQTSGSSDIPAVTTITTTVQTAEDAGIQTTTAISTKKTTAVKTKAKLTTVKTTTKKSSITVKVTTTAKATEAPTETSASYVDYYFRNERLLKDHFSKHGSEFEGDFDYRTAEDYEKGASDVINNPDALYKLESEDKDHVYYLEETNEFVVLSQDGYIRTYFRPSAGKKYFDRQ
ncbi:MAG: hypothetical protein IKK47_02075 [Ruminococcus sp.]|nr:hypothetical protein [Ruminococcus sp.]